ncbi:hypothetical protein CAL18_14985 [Bordetella genomosp. 7]|jgi:hypothetical protein|uniref:DUF2783 domain-containing protein n=1 Tax=Bordetella genomosp. 7 TaxID=1416805 RepID=A0A261QXB5_9BORD|nr:MULTISPECIES: DUF2783 domain-containing protein [Bordetella]OZI17167.1 hypothetical protein CAL19_15095 [Bordetella genomosp. 7]OZI17432.1 hypothetical protein CAL18_14985 [Bordetella genomosp. 7]
MPLIIDPNLASPDAFYEALIDTHRDLDDTQSAELNAALILLLANHIGDMEVISEALERARRSVLTDAAAPAEPSRRNP